MREETKQDIVKEWIFCGILFVVLILLGAYALVQGGKAIVAGVGYIEAKNAAMECAKWEDYERVFPPWDEESQTGYFILQWQKDQCESVGVELRGHVVDYQKQ